ncbi:hypothetical protein EDB85DRAFT_2198666 [Lactarius pseudohatsudake]|nr:hypothetical protein EDB85DRAFT_2198666 [Lactarius pseudohatsudake]
MGDKTSTRTHTHQKPVPGLMGMGSGSHGYGYQRVMRVWKPVQYQLLSQPHQSQAALRRVWGSRVWSIARWRAHLRGTRAVVQRGREQKRGWSITGGRKQLRMLARNIKLCTCNRLDRGRVAVEGLRPRASAATSGEGTGSVGGRVLKYWGWITIQWLKNYHPSSCTRHCSPLAFPSALHLRAALATRPRRVPDHGGHLYLYTAAHVPRRPARHPATLHTTPTLCMS